MEKLDYIKIALERIPPGFEGNDAYEEMASEAAVAGEKSALPLRTFVGGLSVLYKAYASFLNATNHFKIEPEDYKHWRNRPSAARLDKKHGEPWLSGETLSAAVSEYLKGELRVKRLDRGLLDALVARELFAYIDQSAGFGAMATKSGCLIVPFGIVIAWQVIFGDGQWSDMTVVVAVIAGLLLVAALWPKRGTLALYSAMKDTYQLLGASVVSIPELRRRIEAARDRGVVWPVEIYALIDDIEARTKAI